MAAGGRDAKTSDLWRMLALLMRCSDWQNVKVYSINKIVPSSGTNDTAGLMDFGCVNGNDEEEDEHP